MTQEEQLIRRYFQTFNRQDIEGLMECFHENPVLVDAKGRRVEGRADVRRCYEASFASFPDGRCQLRTCTPNNGHAVAASRFLGTRQRDGNVVEAIGPELIEIVDGKIKEIRDQSRASESDSDGPCVRGNSNSATVAGNGPGGFQRRASHQFEFLKIRKAAGDGGTSLLNNSEITFPLTL